MPKPDKQLKDRDHKKLGKELDLFVFSSTVGKGLPLLTPRGSVIRRELERFIVDEEIGRGYEHVYTPDIANLALYKKSGHYPYYKASMYAPIVIDDEEYMLRPMSCPHHYELFLSKTHKYSDLPVRFAELAKLYRYEQSGELSGLERARSFTLADAHIFARPDQVEKELHGALDLVDHVTKVLTLKQGKDYFYRLSLGDRKDTKKFFKDTAAWDHSEALLRKVLKKRKAHFTESPGDAAFYGPKIDVQMRNANGKEETAFTVQYDFIMPQRFDLNYLDEKGKKKGLVVIHRSSIGAIERVIAFLIEHFAGAFPAWLAPVQARVVTVSDKTNTYARRVLGDLLKSGIRAEIDDSNETIGKKIRAGELMKVPYLLVVGEKEQKGKYVGVRKHGKGDLGQKSLTSFIEELKKEIDKKI